MAVAQQGTVRPARAGVATRMSSEGRAGGRVGVRARALTHRLQACLVTDGADLAAEGSVGGELGPRSRRRARVLIRVLVHRGGLHGARGQTLLEVLDGTVGVHECSNHRRLHFAALVAHLTEVGNGGRRLR